MEGSTSILTVNKNKVEVDCVGDNVVTIVEKKKTTQQCEVRVEIGRKQLAVQSNKEDILEDINRNNTLYSCANR